MKEYKSHKVVKAAKIAGVEVYKAGAHLKFEGVGGADVDNEWGMKHGPSYGGWSKLIGGYFVSYPDGYTSWSPAEAFEEGYTLHDPSAPADEKGAPGLPVKGYKPTQPQEAIDAVNVFKVLEERVLRHIEHLERKQYAVPPEPGHVAFDPRLMAAGRTQLQGAFMFLARAVFQPGRVTLPEDGDSAER